MSNSKDPGNTEELKKFLREAENITDKIEASTLNCASCNAMFTVNAIATMKNCPFCNCPISSATSAIRTFIKPKSYLPFNIKRNEANLLFTEWVKNLWFAPKELMAYAQNCDEKLSGVFLPYWSFYLNTCNNYAGQRGIYQTSQEIYTSPDSNYNNNLERTREVQTLWWTHLKGHTDVLFENLLVNASPVLPSKVVEKLEPWDLDKTINFSKELLNEYHLLEFQHSIQDGFKRAGEYMQSDITMSIKKDIGGDEQRIERINTSFNKIAYTAIALPVWISTYTYKDKQYTVLINARTGEVQGEKPIDQNKVLLVIGLIVMVMLVLLFLFSN